jgi:Rha family phage regulatory protein
MDDINLTVVDGRITTTSNQIAEHFGKRHDNVLRAIANLDCSPDFRLLNFEETISYRDNPKGGNPIEDRAYNLTRDGFSFLCMGFTGKKASEWKEKYIAAFNGMAAQLAVDGAGPATSASAAAARPLRQAINRKAHEIALKQYDVIHAIITRGVDDNLASGADIDSAFAYVESIGERADGTVFLNVADLRELSSVCASAINEAARAIAAISRIEQRTGLQLAHRIPRRPDSLPKHARLVDEVLGRMAANVNA